MIKEKTGEILGKELTGVNQILPHKHKYVWDLFLKSCAILRDLMGSPPLGGINSAVITFEFFSKVC